MGESDSISLAKELGITLLIDEKKGRKVAIANGISIVGLLGVIIRNYRREFIDKRKAIDIFKSLKDADFRVSQRLENEFYEFL